MPPPITALGIVHTVVSLVAIACGLLAFWRAGAVCWTTRLGRVYVGATFVAAATALAIHTRSALGPGHMLALLTLAALGVAWAAPRLMPAGLRAQQLQTAALTITLFCHAIPGTTEALTRLPLDAPLLASPDHPVVKVTSLLWLLACGATVWWQMRRLKSGALRVSAGQG